MESVSEKTFTGRHMLLIMIGFFSVIIAVNFTMASMARGTWTGLVVKNTYVESQQFNEHLATATAQQKKGIYSSLTYQNNQLSMVLRSKDGSPVTADRLVVEIGRPAFEQQDRTLELVPAADGFHRLEIHLNPGNWDLRISGTYGQSSYRRDARIFVDAQGKGSVE